MQILLWITAAMSLVAFAAMGWDKMQARKHAWRVPEKTLFLLALLMGGIGGSLGMYIFHHKTRHWYFAVGFPVIAAAQIVLLFFLFRH